MSKITLKCNTCGNEFSKARNEYNRKLRQGKDKFYCCLSCAAKRPENIAHLTNVKSDYPIWEHCDNRSDEYSKFKQILGRTKNKNRKFHRDNNLTAEYLYKLWEQQCSKCPFTGFELELPTSKAREGKTPINLASIDRIDNDLGYIEGNVRFVSVMYNYARNNFTDEQVLQFAQAVVINASK